MPTYSNQKGDMGYTGADIKALLRFPEFMETEPITFASMSTISYSLYRDKFPVRALGYTRAKGYTRGARTVAGTLIFKMLDKSAINRFIKELYQEEHWKSLSMVPDELPPFTVDIHYVNERGNKTKVTLIGLEIAEGNQVISSQKQVAVNEQYSFVAQDIVQVDI